MRDPSTQPLPAASHRTDSEAQKFVVDSAIRIGVLGLLAYWSLTLVAPFLSIVVWAGVLAVALYPIFAWLARAMGGRRTLAAALVTLVLLLIVIGPVAALVASLIEWSAALVSKLQAGQIAVPLPPDSVRQWPLIGERAYAFWTLAADNLAGAALSIKPQLLKAGGTVLGSMAGLGLSALAFAASSVIAGCLLVPGPRLVAGARLLATRIVSSRGDRFVDMAGTTIRNVSRGVIGISLLQALLGGIGMIAAGVPLAGPLALAMLVLGIVQIGPGIVVVGVIVWAWSTLDPLAAGLLTAYLVPVALIDNVLRPIVMAKGLPVPMLVILVGVIGGTLSYGLIGLFLGPIVLSVFYELLVAWVRDRPQVAAPAATTEDS
ncbi:MAG: AI-2E family transporter [Alphaproteobacteria bacterium]|nr:AI-2E family transporter [Alphaproteobacteria bacterium]MCB9930474.1 AI-2E family transporter [Alphaproteobacteria bacterium]